MFKVRGSNQKACIGCGHGDRKHFGFGLCKPCYNGWNRQRRCTVEVLRGLRVSFYPNRPMCHFCGKRDGREQTVDGIATCKEHREAAGALIALHATK